MFALRRLREQGLAESAFGALVDHVVAAATAELDGVGRWNVASFGRLLGLYDNIVAALRWCLAHDADSARALPLCAVLWGVVHQARADEIAALCTQTLGRWPDLAAPYAADAAATAATARFLTGDAAGALALAEAALPTAEASRLAPVLLRRAMAYALQALGDPAGAIREFADIAARARTADLPAFALEADVYRAQLLAADSDTGENIAAARALALAARTEAVAVGSPINEIWAQSILAQFTLRTDVTAGLPEVSAALDAARRIPYPAVIAVNLRALAWGLLRAGRLAEAAAAVGELLDLVLHRGAVAELRGVLLTAAELLHATGSSAWDELAATAYSLPPAGPTASAMDALARVPGPRAAPLGRREAVALVRSELRQVQAAPSAPPAPMGPAAPSPALPIDVTAPTLARLTDNGQYWELEFAGRSAHLKPSKGLADLRRLLFAPGREVHCLELMGAGVEESSTGDVLDRRARLQYEQRVRELQSEIDDAESDSDHGRADHARLEMDALVDQLTAALGLGGRSRRAGGSAERARSAVTQRIRSAIRGVGAVHPEFARHLEASISTGTYCVYRPEHPITWKH